MIQNSGFLITWREQRIFRDLQFVLEYVESDMYDSYPSGHSYLFVFQDGAHYVALDSLKLTIRIPSWPPTHK